MADQLPIDFNPPRARKGGPATSEAAAARVGEFAGEHYRKILAALQAGPATSYEIAERSGLQEHRVGKRLSELAAAGAIIDTGETRPSPSGRACRVWRRCAKLA